jgi:hypothetical protein
VGELFHILRHLSRLVLQRLYHLVFASALSQKLRKQKAPASRETGALEGKSSFSADHGKSVCPIK